MKLINIIREWAKKTKTDQDLAPTIRRKTGKGLTNAIAVRKVSSTENKYDCCYIFLRKERVVSPANKKIIRPTNSHPNCIKIFTAPKKKSKTFP